MKTILSVVATLTVTIVVCIGAWQFALYRQANSPEGLAAARKASEFIALQQTIEADREKLD